MASVFKRGGKANRGGWYYVTWLDGDGKRRTKCAKTTDRDAAQQFANKLEAESMLRRKGIIPREAERLAIEGSRPLEEHLTDFEAKLSAAQRSPLHITNTLRLIRDVIAFATWTVANDINADGAARFAEKLRREGRAARTVQSYIVALKSFSRWLTQGGKLPADPLAGLKRPNPATDRRHERRPLSPDEWRLLEAAARGGPIRYGMEGPARALLYRLAIETGLRSNELRSLTRASLRLDDAQPCVIVKARSTKNKKDARQFIQPETVAMLREHAAGMTPGASLFDLPHACNVVRMLRADFSAARRKWLKEAKQNPAERLRREESDFLKDLNHAGQVFDFHSLRHTCGAWLSMAGAHPKAVQTVMRHSAITLTLDTYGHLFPGQEADTVERLGRLLGPSPDGEADREALQATGTTGQTLEMSESAQRQAQRAAQQTGGLDRREAAQPGEEADGLVERSLNANTLRPGTSGDARRRWARKGEVVRGGIEPPTHGFSVATFAPDFPEKTTDSPPSAAPGAALETPIALTDPALAAIVEAWPHLPEAIRRGILAMIDAAATSSGKGGAK